MSLAITSQKFARVLVHRHSATKSLKPQSARAMSSSARGSEAPKVASLVSPKWLSGELKNASNVVVLDTSWYMPSEGHDIKSMFNANRIPGSRLFNIDEVCDKKTTLPHMLPTPEEFAAAVGQMGIGNDTHVVCYDTNPLFMASARVWWMFRYFGHDKVSLVEGGLDAWIVAGLPTENLAPKHQPKEVEFKMQPVRKQLLKNMDQIKNNIKKEEFLLIDARSPGRFRGTEPEPRPGLASGHVPGSINIPFRKVIDGFGSFASEAQLRTILSDIEMDLDQPLAATCGSGTTAATVAFALHLLGKSDVAVYDGSWSEYGQLSLGNKVETGL